jgi:hypothetical protein
MTLRYFLEYYCPCLTKTDQPKKKGRTPAGNQSGTENNLFITTHMAELGPGGRHGLSEAFKYIVAKAGLDLQNLQDTGLRSISKRAFHPLQHSFTSTLANAGVSPELK